MKNPTVVLFVFMKLLIAVHSKDENINGTISEDEIQLLVIDLSNLIIEL